ncbi:hypothetical protein [Rhodococcus qingshengii]|uniref:hypothetical protein n=1 Tax=Rhodococcus qingshengii TaxID=334542 RepID=UPI001A3BE6D9|nr:hypothetical protein [Rhodococcus qingshengii]ULD38837.1 hypothetical protein JKI97_00615 [Rhodococcus qingshengii]
MAEESTANRWNIELKNSFGEFWKLSTIVADTAENAQSEALARWGHLNGGGWSICSCTPA